MNDVVFVMTNSKLAKNKKIRKVIEYSIGETDSNDGWIMDNDQSLLDDDILDFIIESGDLEIGNQNDGENGIGN